MTSARISCSYFKKKIMFTPKTTNHLNSLIHTYVIISATLYMYFCSKGHTYCISFVYCENTLAFVLYSIKGGFSIDCVFKKNANTAF